MADGRIPDEFEVGEPVLVCRWRLAGRELACANRHLRALGARTVCGEPLSRQLVAWAKQHIEWTLAEGAAENPDGVLMLVVDDQGRAAMAVGGYEPLARSGLADLAARACAGRREAQECSVAPEVLWCVRDGALVRGTRADEPLSGANTLVADLAKTMGIPTSCDASLAECAAGERGLDAAEAFLVSDEHGVVVAADYAGPMGAKLAESYKTLLGRAPRAH